MPSRHPEWRDAFLTSLLSRLAGPVSTALNSHCLTESTLNKLFSDLQGDGLKLKFSKSAIRDWLIQIGLLSPVPVEYDNSYPSRGTRFYSFDLGKSSASGPTPYEMLQAYDPDGVICYFSAVAFYSLSTQQPAHHHIAALQNPAEPTQSRPHPAAKRPSPSHKKRNPFGTALFSYGGLPYYRTFRTRRLVPGVQLRYLGPTAVIRITTLEQTLLDTLHRPLSCGGPAIVFEAWEQSLPKLNEMRLVEYLTEMDHLPSLQRVGYVLSDLGYSPSDNLAALFADCLRRLDPTDPTQHRQLLPGFEYTNLRTPWLVYGP